MGVNVLILWKLLYLICRKKDPITQRFAKVAFYRKTKGAHYPTNIDDKEALTGWDVKDTDVKEISKLILELREKWYHLSDKNTLYPFGKFKNEITWDSQAEKLIEGYEDL